MNFTPPPPAPRPRVIRNDKEVHVVAVEWADGTRTAIPWDKLRWACPCAECAGEFGIPGRLATTTSLTDDETTLVALRGVGNYGVGAAWQDGHDTGIYTYPQLRALGAG